MGKKIFWVVIAIMIVLIIAVGWREFGQWLAWIGVVLIAIFGGVKELEEQERERIRERNRRIKEDIERQEAIDTGLEAETDAWRNKVDKLRRSGLLLLILTLGLTFTGSARASDTQQDIYIPADYDSLKTAYVLAWELLDEADRLMLNQQTLIHDQKRIIDELQQIVKEQDKRIYRLTKPSWGVTGGVEVSDTARWKLGIARKWGAISVAGGVGGGDKFCLWGSATLWSQ